jgi:hypothetical protein
MTSFVKYTLLCLALVLCTAAKGDGAATRDECEMLILLLPEDLLDSSCKRNTWFEGLDFRGHCFGGRSPAEGLSGAIVQQRCHLV